MGMIKALGRTVRGMVQTMTEAQAGYATLALLVAVVLVGWIF